jgi:LacI family transcriptional regulator
MNGGTTLKYIAEKLSLSISTVSRALKDHPDISEETKKRVKELASLMEYEPNTYAINLRTNQSKVFGVIVPEISSYFYHSFIESIEEEGKKQGYSLLILQSGDDPVAEMENLKLCRLNRVAGVFVSITTHTTHIENFLHFEEIAAPVIFYDKVPEFAACNKILSADEEAATMAAEEIIKKKKKNVLALFGNKEMSITRKRLPAFERIFIENAPETKLIIEHANSPEEAYTVTKHMLSKNEKPDVIFCMSDEILTGVMKIMQQLQIKIPDTVSVIALSNGFIPTLYFPEITYVETSGKKLGKLAFQRMIDHIAGKTFIQEISIRAKLVSGGSL